MNIFRIKPDLKYSTFFCGLLGASTTAKIEFLIKILEIRDFSDQSIILCALAAAADPTVLNLLMDELFRNDSKIQNSKAIFSLTQSMIQSNPSGLDAFLNFMLHNQDKEIIDKL